MDALFFVLGWARCSFPKKGAWTHYAKPVFLHPVGSASHVLHFGASGARNIDALFFMLGWDRYGYDKKCAMTRYAELVFFASGGIYGSCSGFQYIREAKC
jgi:hypothetical protein